MAKRTYASRSFAARSFMSRSWSATGAAPPNWGGWRGLTGLCLRWMSSPAAPAVGPGRFARVAVYAPGFRSRAVYVPGFQTVSSEGA